ncbi:MAG: hypothetical protein AB7E47_03605 [Desulfovibrionaceae bacterium]
MDFSLSTLATGLAWPLLRLLGSISIGLFIANLIEALNWTHAVARVAGPLIRAARLKDVAGASFSMAFFSGVAANTMLAESYDKGELTTRELVLSNLFNSLPTYFLHLPTMFFITLPFLGQAAFLYVGLTLVAALLRTGGIVVLGRFLLPELPDGCVVCRLEDEGFKGWKAAVRTSWRRFKKRIRKIVYYTLPIYTAMYFASKYGLFTWIEHGLANSLGTMAFLPPKAMGIVVFHVAAEFTAGLAAAGALLQDGGLAVRDVVVALLLGNVLSSPMRAFRHQFPYYAGIFKPRTALHLIMFSQSLRMCSVFFVGLVYFLLT